MRPSANSNSSTSGRASRVDDGELPKRRDLDLDVEVAGVGEDGAVLEALDRAARDDVLVAGGRAEDVADLGRALDRHHLVAVHERLERPHGIDLGDDHVRAHAPRAHRHAAPRPAVAADDEAPPGEKEVGGADDPVDRGLAGAVTVVEEVLGVGLVDRDDREGELALGLERLEPDDAGRRLLGPAEDLAQLVATVLVQDADHVGPVVHRQLRPVVDRGRDVRVVRLVVLAADGEDGNAVLGDERCGHVVLRGERVRRAEHDVGASRLQRAGEVRGLRRDVEAGRDADAVQRPLLLETLADRGENRHVPVGPLDADDARGSEAEILDVVAGCGRGHGRGSVY